MKYLIKRIAPDGVTQDFYFKKKPTLKEMQDLVGGYLEAVLYLHKYANTEAEVYVDEEGLRKGLPINEEATRLWRGALSGLNYDPARARLVGPIIFVMKVRSQ